MNASTPVRPSAGKRPAAVAGLFYPGTPADLRAAIDDGLAQAHGASQPAPKALIVPHAGYVYSGPIAASAYATLLPGAGAIRRVVLLGPCHRVPVRGLALPDADAFETPLGTVRIDDRAAQAIADLPQVVRSVAAHAQEHSLEVQLPFLQRVLGEFTLLPLAVGDATADEVAQVLERLWGGPETLVVISSDLSHYHRYEAAQAIDAATARAILDFDAHIDHEQACGATPIAGFLIVARRRALVPTLLDLRNSGDTAGDRRRVVGYAAFAFRESRDPLAAFDDARGRELLRIARESIREALGATSTARPSCAWLRERHATFVTLKRRRELRGCVGSIVAQRALGEDVAANAKAAAFADPRFSPVVAGDLAHTVVEVSLLSSLTPLATTHRHALLAQLRPGEDGLVVTSGPKQATFLPQVWHALPDRGDFVDELLRKAGLPAAFPIDRCRFERYRVRKWSEPDFWDETTPTLTSLAAPRGGGSVGRGGPSRLT